MNREIKFRAWDKEEKRMLYNGDELWDDPSADYIIGFCEDGLVIREMDAGWTTMEDVDLMQFTGLKDKNGKEIFEGDIVYLGTTREPINYYQVIFYDGCFHLDGLNDPLSEYKWGEVIGNIYENPELVEEEK